MGDFHLGEKMIALMIMNTHPPCIADHINPSVCFLFVHVLCARSRPFYEHLWWAEEEGELCVQFLLQPELLGLAHQVQFLAQLHQPVHARQVCVEDVLYKSRARHSQEPTHDQDEWQVQTHNAAEEKLSIYLFIIVCVYSTFIEHKKTLRALLTIFSLLSFSSNSIYNWYS